MFAGIRIFESLLNIAVGANSLLTKAGMLRLLRRVFGNFSVSGEGIAIEMHPEGRLHLRVLPTVATGTDTALHPFKVRGSAGAYTVEPGGIYTMDEHAQPVQFLPTGPLNLPLKSYVFNAASNFTGYVVLRVKFSGYHGGAMLEIPWSVSITASNPFIGDRALIRNNGLNSPQDGIRTIILADIQNGEVYAQRVTTSLGIYAFWNEVVVVGY